MTAPPPEETADGPVPDTEAGDRRILGRYDRLYRLALGIVALAIAGSAWATVQTVQLDEGVAEQVNVSGRQRMLSQRVVFTANTAMADVGDSAAVERLRAAVALMRTSHARLSDPEAEGSLARERDVGAREMYFGPHAMDRRVDNYLDSAELILDWMDRGRPAETADRAESALSFLTVRAQGPMLAGLDSVVTAYERAGEDAVRRVIDVQLLLTAFSLLLLVALGAAVFRPMGRRLADAFEATREREARIARTRHLHKVGLLAASVAHDLKNFAGVARGNVQLLREDITDAGGDASMAVDALESLDRIEATARRLLGLARLDDAERAVVDPHAFVEGLEGLLRAAARPAEFELRHLSSGAVRIDVVETDFESALLNLVGNAGEAIAHGVGTRVRVEVDSGSDEVAIRVSDDGPGIPHAIRGMLFQPFVSGKERGAGSGLGLAQVRRFVDASGGWVDVETGEAGTTFTLRLPAVPG